MTCKKFSLFSMTILLTAISVLDQAEAYTVFDPLNYSQNLLTAAHTLEQINNQIRSIQNQFVMLENMAKNLDNLNYSSLGQINGSLSRIGDLMLQANSLSFNLTQFESEWSTHYPTTYNSLTTDDRAENARTRWLQAMGGFRQTMQVQSQIVENVQSDQSVLSDLVSQSQSAGGTLQAQQASNQLIALGAKQQMQIQSMMAAQYRAEAEEAARKAQVEEEARVVTKKFLGSSQAY